jgi:hypothetical protein
LSAAQPQPKVGRKIGLNVVVGLQLAALFLVVFGARLWFIGRYGNALPFWDQWDGEASLLIKPWLEGTLAPASLLAPHNEHRIVLTRLLALALFKLNGQWDALLEMTVNAALCATIVVLIAAAAFKLFQTWSRLALLLLLGILFSLPFSWENTLAGFQSQFYFLLLFSLLAMWGLTTHSWRSLGWWVGAVALCLACLSMATGFFAALSILVLLGLRCLKQRARPVPSQLFTAMLCLVVSVAGWVSRTEVQGHARLKAGSIPDWVMAFTGCLAWPWHTNRVLAVVMHLPLFFLALSYITRPASWRRDQRQTIELILGTGIWFLSQAAAVAYARGAPTESLASRYMDIFAIGAVVNFLAALLLIAEAKSIGWRKLAYLPVSIWSVALVSGLVPLTRYNFQSDLPGRRGMLRTGEENVRGYVRSGNFRQYLEHKPELELPYPDKVRLQELLDDSVIRGILPANVRPRLHFQAPEPAVAPGGFVKSGSDSKTALPSYETVVGSYSETQGGAAVGTWESPLEHAPSLPYLRIDVSGYLGKPDLSLEFRGEASGKHIALFPGRPAGERWQANFVERPGDHSEPVSIKAIDQSQADWFAFTEPVEVGRFSYWTLCLLGWSSNIILAGVALGLISAFGPWAILMVASMRRNHY